MQEPITGRRIVSRASLLGKRISLHILIGILGVATLCGVICGICCFGLAFGFLAGDASEGHIIHGLKWMIGLLLSAGVLLPLSLLTAKGTKSTYGKVAELQSFIVANAADLPHSDSLVRASQEPAQAQEGVLLRAASVEAQAGQEGQLLRASVGGPE